jgi:hypothetical protein
MSASELSWLADAFKRHLVLFAARGHRKIDPRSFETFNEASLVLIADRIFSGLGYLTWPERKVYSGNLRADLWAEVQDGSNAHLIEIKMIWDNVDLRLHRDRLRELLSDFNRLATLQSDAKKIVVWVVFCPNSDIAKAKKEGTKLRLGDALEAVETQIPAASLQGQSTADLVRVCECPDWKYAQIYCWMVGSAPR